ncbi:MAG TPA: hypothetical protein VMO81_03465 [Aestuariivirgaceae bacterium]|nr:hypothetical protein [Aestuariivirgaceae bacterium]
MPATAVQAIDPWEFSPIDRPSLAALKDLGLTDAQVASYYRVPQHEVAMLRAAYGIADQAPPDTSVNPTSAASRRRRLPWRRRA